MLIYYFNFFLEKILKTPQLLACYFKFFKKKTIKFFNYLIIIFFLKKTPLKPS